MSETREEYLAGLEQSRLRSKLGDMQIDDLQRIVNDGDYYEEHRDFLIDIIMEHPEIHENYYK